MLTCLPGSGELCFPRHSHPQMNTGLQKWDTPQKMRTAQHPTAAELDAYAKKVASQPLTIKIFPNSIKVPQRKHIRRTVNGLDTSGQRYAPYPPSPATLKAGLLAIVRAPAVAVAKGVAKDFDRSSRTCLPPEAMMNPPSAPYPATPSTLNHPQALARQQQALQHMPPGGLAPHPALHPGGHLLQQPPPPGMHGGRKMAEADAPPNVTVSTSTIPLSMAATLHAHPPPDLSAIVHQINQFCQARAGINTTSVCEGQIANPSPISRNLLISASSRVSAHHGPLPACAINPGDHAAAAATLGLPLGVSAGRGPPSYQSEIKQAAAAAAAWNQQQLAHLQQMCGEGVGPAGMVGKPPGSAGQPFAGGKASGYGLELCPGQASFNVKPLLEKATPSPPVNGLPGPLPYTNGHYFQPLWNNLLPTPNSDSSGSQDMALPFHTATATGGQQQQQQPALECAGGPHYRGGPGGALPAQGGMMPAMEYLGGGDLQSACLREHGGGGGPLGKASRPSMNRGPEPAVDGRNLHIQHPGYR